jgi:four helix bundle protein
MDKIQLLKRTKTFSIDVFKFLEKILLSPASKVVTYQLLKASSSTAANYRAACRAKSTPILFIN